MSKLEKREKFDQLRKAAEDSRGAEAIKKSTHSQHSKPLMFQADERTQDGPDQDIPFFLKEITNRYPFGNVHMSLMVGPLVIENGVPQ
jgi:hypothetical protein